MLVSLWILSIIVQPTLRLWYMIWNNWNMLQFKTDNLYKVKYDENMLSLQMSSMCMQTIIKLWLMMCNTWDMIQFKNDISVNFNMMRICSGFWYMIRIYRNNEVIWHCNKPFYKLLMKLHDSVVDWFDICTTKIRYWSDDKRCWNLDKISNYIVISGIFIV